MTYESQISFTLDTICPWTFLAKKRLDEALRRFRHSEDSKSTTFVVKYFPYQLFPETSNEGLDKYEWYKKSTYGDSEEKMKMYITLMTAYGKTAGIDFKFGGTVANTLDAHRVIQHFQGAMGLETADKIINSLYSQYFEQEQHPSKDATLLRATRDAGIPEDEARPVIEDKNVGLIDVKASSVTRPPMEWTASLLFSLKGRNAISPSLEPRTWESMRRLCIRLQRRAS
ncbi:hypothetical protein A1O3_06390, partial [Capronia epimyces CBS 606.96]